MVQYVVTNLVNTVSFCIGHLHIPRVCISFQQASLAYTATLLEWQTICFLYYNFRLLSKYVVQTKKRHVAIYH